MRLKFLAQKALHHSNWRLLAMQALENEQSDELHYSSVITMRREDIPKIREAMVRAIEEVRGKVRSSTDEDSVLCYTLDLFELCKRF
jgi:hypothetical protein